MSDEPKFEGPAPDRPAAVLGRLRWVGTTAEERSAQGRAAARIRWGKRKRRANRKTRKASE